MFPTRAGLGVSRSGVGECASLRPDYHGSRLPQFFLCRQAANTANIAPASKSTSVPGSGTGATEPAGEAASGAAVPAGSRTNAALAPMVKLEPSGRAATVVTSSVPAVTNVPPV